MIVIDKSSEIPLYVQLYSEIKEHILSGEFPPNSRLTPIRKMAGTLGVSKNTVDTAYKQLMSEGFIRSATGSGYYVEDVVSELELSDGAAKRKSSHSKRRKVNEGIVYNFNYSSIENSSFPWNKWRHYLSETIADMEYQDFVDYEASKGSFKLRRELKKYLYETRGIVCSEEEIIVCAGTQHAAELSINLLGASGLKVAFEEPGFYTTRNIFVKSGCQMHPVSVDEQGLNLDELEKTDVEFVYVTPSRQMPLGAVMPVENRRRLLEWAEKNDAYIFEDDYDSEFRHGEPPVPAVKSFDSAGRVIFAGTFSKVLLPSFRLAYIVLPAHILELYEKKYKYFNSFLPTAHQLALAKFMHDGEFERHVRRIIKINDDKCRMLRESIERHFKDNVKFIGNAGGTHLLVQIKNVKDGEEFVNLLKNNGIKILSVNPFYAKSDNHDKNIFLVGFNSIDEKLIDEGCRKIMKLSLEQKSS